jgi:hypothetical protein
MPERPKYLNVTARLRVPLDVRDVRDDQIAVRRGDFR